jgi:hypothetical protein
MPTKSEWQAVGAILLIVLAWFPWISFFGLVRRAWSGKREKLEPQIVQ